LRISAAGPERSVGYGRKKAITSLALTSTSPLVELARRRSLESGLSIHFDVGSATKLPFSDESMDVCLLPELLEHVEDWQACLREAARVLKPGGVLYLSTTNVLCPKQEEFNLPMYSWYPGFLKRKYERLAVTTKPELANFARYPAVHWFSFYGLSSFLSAYKIRCHDRFEMLNTDKMGIVPRTAVSLVRALAAVTVFGTRSYPGYYNIRGERVHIANPLRLCPRQPSATNDKPAHAGRQDLQTRNDPHSRR
jgi:SAM-dependent methyltransferase